MSLTPFPAVVVATILCGCLLSRSGPAFGQQPAPSTKAYAEDKRLDKPVTISVEQATVAFAVAAVSRECGVSLLVQDLDDPGLRPLPFRKAPYPELAGERRPARQVMDGLAEVLMSEWKRAGDTYVLTDYRDLEVYTGLSDAERLQRARKATEWLFRNFSAEQKERLKSGEELLGKHLSRRQQRSFFEVGRYWWYRNRDTLSPEVLYLEECAIRLTPDGKRIGVYLARLSRELSESAPTVLVTAGRLK